MLSDFHIKQHDTRDIIAIQLEYADGSTVNGDLAGASVFFNMRSAAGTVKVNRGVGQILDVQNKIVGYQWATGDTDTANAVNTPYQAEFEIDFSDGTKQSFPNSPPQGKTAPFIDVHVWEDIA